MKNQKSKIKNQNQNQNFKLKTVYKIISFAFCIVILHFALCTLHLSKANASSQSLSVSPIIINVPLSPDKTYTKEITLHNITDNPLPLRASLNDFQTTGEEGDYLFTETKNNPLLSWISLPETEFILDPQETKTIEMTITTPKEIPLGGYYGMLFFELVPQNVTTTATRVVPKVGVLLLANIGTPDAKQAEIATFSIPTFLQDNNLPLLLRVKNTSLHFFTAKPILKLTPLLPIPAPQSPAERNEVVYLEEKIVFQGKIRRWEETINLSRYQPNLYKIDLSVSTGNGNFVQKETYILLLPEGKYLFIAVVLAMLILGIVWRKRLLRALSILFEKKH